MDCLGFCAAQRRAVRIARAAFVTDGRGQRVLDRDSGEEFEVYGRADFGLSGWEIEMAVAFDAPLIVGFTESLFAHRVFGLRGADGRAVVVKGLERAFEEECARAGLAPAP